MEQGVLRNDSSVLVKGRRMMDSQPPPMGLQLISDHKLTVLGPPRKRMWRERLFTRPWRPWVGWENTFVPDPVVYKVGNKLIAHPAVIGELRRLRKGNRK